VRFEVRYPTGAQHEVELSGSVAVLGRDPSSDLVLNDAKCSRRHAVLEAGPDGIAVRDAGSANGIFVNGKKVERAQLGVGDVVRLGETTLKVLAEEVPGTLVMAPEDVEDFGGTRPVQPGPSALGTPPPTRLKAPIHAGSAPTRETPPARVPSERTAAPPPKAARAPLDPKTTDPFGVVAVPPPPLPRSEAPAPAGTSRRSGGSGKTLLVVGLVGCLLLIVLTVVAIVAAIFLPSYLRSRTTRLETGTAISVARSASVEVWREG
jgi:predicted component of type VI protein secretion system